MDAENCCKLTVYFENNNPDIIYIKKINSKSKIYFEPYKLIPAKPVNKNLKEYTLDELKSEFGDIEEAYIKAVYDYMHKDRFTTCEQIVRKYHLSRATLYRVLDKVKKKIK